MTLLARLPIPREFSLLGNIHRLCLLVEPGSLMAIADA
ncbi:hypothetical protein B0G71_8125 [Paraburkholderia sp. BL27I4N3]|nr:hypothetical protein B0G71_8125 [Paraburkholderia sp. BL27I4N3]